MLVDITGMADTTVVAQLLNKSDEVVKEVSTGNGRAEFFYVAPGTYYMRMFVDSNGNGKWDMTLTWNPLSRPLFRQKPAEITKQKPEKEKTIKRRNLERAQKLGIPYPGI